MGKRGPGLSTRYLIAILLLPLIVLWRQDNVLFTGFGYLDPWFYFGFFRNLAEFKRNLFPGTYYGSRLSFLLPGAALHAVLPALAANYVLHLGVHTLATVSLFLTLKWLAGPRRAFLAAMVFSVNPWLWSATGWDYVDGVAIAYCLLTVALLTWSALEPGRRWTLFAAGVAMAALIYANLYWITMAWMLPVVYIAMTRVWHGTPLLRSLRALCIWFGAGCLALTVLLGAINWVLDGHFFFYAPSVLAAMKIKGDNLQWFDHAWKDGAPAPWLLFAAAAVVASLVILLARDGRWTDRGNTAAVMFAVMMLCASGWMTYTQVRGKNPVLNIYFYACDLLPFAFLVIGTWFWPKLDSLSQRAWLGLCFGAAVLFAAAWCGAPSQWVLSTPHAALIGLAVITASLFFRWRMVGVALSLLASSWFVAMGAGMRYADPDPHALRRQYDALIDARSHIEDARNGAGVRFWYDAKGQYANDAVALNSSYVWSESLIDPAKPCDIEMPPSTLIAAIEALPQEVQAALSPCWEGKGLRAVPLPPVSIDRGSYRYGLAMLRVETEPGAWTPAGSLPIDQWILHPGSDDKAYLRPADDGLHVQTHAAPESVAATYPVWRAPKKGRYRFAMLYWKNAGSITFGACVPGHPGEWLTSATKAYWDGENPELILWLDLAEGQEIQLAIANNNGQVKLPASFVMKGVTIDRVSSTTP